MSRLLLLAATVLGLLLGLEVLCRVQADGLAAVAHRVRFKLALLHAKGPVDFVSLGTSRTNDGLNPSLLELGNGFSAATPSSSLPTLEFQAAQLGPQKLVFVELSKPQSQPNEMDADTAPPAGSFAGDPVGEWLREHSALLKVRRAFAIENLPRVFALLAAGSLDGSEWFRSRQLVETFRPPAPPDGVSDDAEWKPQASNPHPDPLPKGEGDNLQFDEDSQRIVDGYARVLNTLRAQGTRVVLVGPPVASLARAEECTHERQALRDFIAKKTAAPLLDFTCAEVDDRWFVDQEHLSSPGRAKYSKVLGEAARALP